MVDDPLVLASSGIGGDGGSSQLNLRDRTTHFTPKRYSSPVTVKSNRTLKLVVSSALVRLHPVSLNDVGNVIYCGKIGTSQHLQGCVAPINPGFTTCGVRSHSTQAKGFVENTVFIKKPLVRNKVTVYLIFVLLLPSVSFSIVQSLLQLERTVSFWASLLPRL